MILKNVRVLDLSRVLAGPYCSQILGDLGADVLKVEAPGRGDDSRHWGDAYYSCTNRNKRSVILDFQNEKDLQRTLALAAKADVVIENFKVGNLKKFGLDYESLSKKNPRLIYCSITGFGQTGPRAHEPGYDFLIQGLSGLMSMNGPEGGPPTKVGLPVVDLFTGLFATIGVLSALHERNTSGRGQYLDVSLLESQLSMMSYAALGYLMTGAIPKPSGNRQPMIAPYGSFETADAPLLITIGNDYQFGKFSNLLGEKWHEELRFKSAEARAENYLALGDLINQRLRTQKRDYWMKLFEGHGFPFGPMLNMKEVSEDPQVIFRKCFGTMDDGKTPNVQSPLRFSRTPIKKYRRPPKFGEHSNADFD